MEVKFILFCFVLLVLLFSFSYFLFFFFLKTVVPVYMFIIFFRDIKRDIAKKLEKLEKRTQKAIVEIIRKCIYSQIYVSKLFWEKSPFCVIQNYFQETDTKYQNIINPASCPSNITAFFSTTFFTLLSLSEKCPYSKFFWSVFSRIPTEYGKILRISPYSVRVLESTDQKNSKYGHFSRGVYKYEVYFSPNPFYPFKRQLTK